MDHGPKGNLAVFEGNQRGAITLEQEAKPTKIGLHAFRVNLYLYEFFELVLFFIPMDYSP